MTLDPFYLVLESPDWIARMLPCGIRLVQLRIKSNDGPDLRRDGPDLRREILRAKNLCAGSGAQLVINDHWRLAIELGCAHVHLGQDDLQSADLRAIRAAGLSLGVSTETEEDLDHALKLGADAVALQPIFPTRSKNFDRPPQGLERLRRWRERLGARPLIAIGGVSLADAQAVYGAGADCIAVISDVTRAPDPERRAREWLAASRVK